METSAANLDDLQRSWETLKNVVRHIIGYNELNTFTYNMNNTFTYKKFFSHMPLPENVLQQIN